MNSFRSMFGFNAQLIYYLRQNPLNEIYEQTPEMGGIFLGNIYAAYSLDILKKHNITAVLTVAAGTNLKYTPEQGIKHLVIMADDIESYNLSRHFERMSDFIDSCRKEGRNILVHCFAGISRSTTAIVAYRMREYGENYRKIINFIRVRRKEINPNSGFLRQLAQYEKKVRASNEKKAVQYPQITPGLAANQTQNRSKSWNVNQNLGLTVKNPPYYTNTGEQSNINKSNNNNNGKNFHLIQNNGQQEYQQQQQQQQQLKQPQLNQQQSYKSQNQNKFGKTDNTLSLKQKYSNKNTNFGTQNIQQQQQQQYGLMGQQFQPIMNQINNKNSQNSNVVNHPYQVKTNPPKISTIQANQISNGSQLTKNNKYKISSPLKVSKINQQNQVKGINNFRGRAF